MAKKDFKVNDRVKRADGEGCNGTVVLVAEEVTNNSAKEPALLVTVMWDNGTRSIFGVEGLELSA